MRLNILKAEDKSKKPKCYVLDMFPYPSGAGLHVGHPRGYVATDVFARYKKMSGYNVLHPMGWDAYGLPAENYAIKTGTHPSEAMQKNIKRFKKQLNLIDLAYDWNREIDTTNPEYFKWTQWIFLQLFKKGLAYESELPINFCPSCKTGLANEEVVAGKCERCGAEVERKKIRQWVLKITKYADRLLKDLNELDWPKPIKEMQKNWIGKSKGAEIEFKIKYPNNTNFLILHGYKETSKSAFFQKLKSDLQDYGYKTTLLDLPNTCHPSEKEQLEFILKNAKVDKNTIIIAHSLGAVLAMKLLQKINQPIFGLVLVAAAIDPKFPGVKSREYWKTFSWDINYKKLIKLAKHRTIISDLRESEGAKYETLRVSYLRELSKKIKANLIEAKSKQEHFVAKNEPVIINNIFPTLKVFTTRADTLFGATFMVVAPEHKILKKLRSKIENWDEIEKYQTQAAKKSNLERTELEKEKTGIEIKGLKAINPVNEKQIPIFVADYVLADYGTGAIMAVPAHDERDFAFAKKYNIEIIQVIQPDDPAICAYYDIEPQFGYNKIEYHKHFNEYKETARLSGKCLPKTFVGDGIIINSGQFSGQKSKIAAKNIVEWLVKKGVNAKLSTNYKLHDWVFSRQRYWGEPIPIVHCKKCGIVPLPESELPLKLPDVKNYKPTGDGNSPLANESDPKIKKWLYTKCPKCGGEAKRETNTMPQWAGSCWYYLRYIDPENKNQLVDKNKEKYWMQPNGIDLYVGGAEHAVLHLLYARFWHKFLYDIGIVSTKEPFHKLINVGIILASDSRKMSKSFGNVINPDELIDEYGSDAFRMYEMFIGPFTKALTWNTQGIIGMKRFLDKILKIKICESENNNTKLHETIEKVTQDIENFDFNTAISALMELLNKINKKISRSEIKIFAQLLAPFAPKTAQKLWEKIGETGKILDSAWPKTDKSKIKNEKITAIVQINGKVRAKFETDAEKSDNEITNQAKEQENIISNIKDKKIIKEIIFRDQKKNIAIVNLVIK